MKVLHVTGYKSLELGIFKENDPKVHIIKAAIEKRIIQFLEEGLEISIWLYSLRLRIRTSVGRKHFRKNIRK